MAKVKENTSSKRVSKKVTRKGVHCKCKSSKLKSSKLYKKPYGGQGR